MGNFIRIMIQEWPGRRDLKKKVLFICTHNSARSQMAEGFLRALYGDRYEAYSGGTEPSGLNPYAIKVMAEAGVDISGQRSKGLEEFKGMRFDYVVTVCDRAREAAPSSPAGSCSIEGSRIPPNSKGPRRRSYPGSGGSGTRSEGGSRRPSANDPR